MLADGHQEDLRVRVYFKDETLIHQVANKHEYEQMHNEGV